MPSLAGFLFLPLLGGFFFLYFCNRTRFYFRPLDGHRLLFSTSICGAALFTLARLVTIALTHTPLGRPLQENLKAFASFDFSGAAVGALVLGLLLPWPLNYRRTRPFSWRRPLISNKKEALQKRARSVDDLLGLVLRAFNRRKPVLVTLDSGKAYIGYFLQVPGELDAAFLSILPVISGYRKPDTGELELTTHYRRNQELVKNALGEERPDSDLAGLSERQIVLRRSSILTAVVFDSDLYAAHLAERAPKASESSIETEVTTASQPATEEPAPAAKPAKKSRRTSKSSP